MLAQIEVADIVTACVMGLIVYAANTVGFVAGFGPTILAMPLLLLMKDVYFVRPLLTGCGMLMPLGILLTQWRQVQPRVLVRVLLVAGAGLPLGMLAYSYLPKPLLLFLIALFALITSLRGLGEEFFRVKKLRLPAPVLHVVLFFAGLIHGAFTTGGPLFVVYMSQTLPEKNHFRATQGSVSACFNVILFIQLFFFSPQGAGAFTPKVYLQYAIVLPFLGAAMWTGHLVQKRVSAELFRKIVYILLLFSAFSILVNLARG